MQTKKDRSRPTQVTTSPLVVKAQTALRKWQWSLRKDKPNHFDGTLIPTEVLEQILVWFNPHGIICLRLLCRNVNSIITSNEFARLHLSQAIPSDFDATSTTDLKKLKSHFKWENCLDNYQLVFARDYSAMRNLTVLDSPIWSGSRIPTCLHAFEQLTVLYLNGGRFRENRIPPGLGTLSSLRELALQNCFLGGSIPDELGNLGRLELLNLSQNNIIGSFPSSFQNLKTLKRLCVSSNLMDVSAPHWKFLTSLEELDVSYNNRLRILPKEWSDLLNLKKLTAHHCYLQGEIPEAYGSLSHLESLDLSDNYLSGEIPTTLGNLVHLTFLSLAKNQLVGSIPPELGKCVNLETICLGSNKLNGPIPRSFGRLLRLSVLKLGYNKLVGPIPTKLMNLELLRTLNLENNSFDGNLSLIRQINCPSLRSLDLSCNQFRGEFAPCGQLVSQNCLIYMDDANKPFVWRSRSPSCYSSSMVTGGS